MHRLSYTWNSIEFSCVTQYKSIIIFTFLYFELRYNIYYRVVTVMVTLSYDIKKNIEDFGIDNVIQYIC